MKASFLFNNILGTITDNLGALIEFTLIYKTKVLRGEKLTYKSVAKEISKPPFFGS